MKNKNFDNCRVQFKTAKVLSDDRFRYVYYRANPEDITFFDRLFKRNKWKQMFRAYYVEIGYNHMFTPKEYLNMKLDFETVGDVEKYISEQESIINKRKIEAIKKGEIWGD